MEGTLTMKVPISGVSDSSGRPVAGSHRSWEGPAGLPGWELLR